MECDKFCPHQVFERRERPSSWSPTQQLRRLLQGVRKDVRPGRDIIPQQARDHRGDQEDPRGRRAVSIDFLTVTHDKFVFKIPAEGYLFNENDCWVHVTDNRARVGVSDFVQQSLTDITYFEPARVGTEIEQFDEVGSIESGKSMMDVLSPVSGRIVAVNTELVDSPELVNEDPYGKGWIAEIELRTSTRTRRCFWMPPRMPRSLQPKRKGQRSDATRKQNHCDALQRHRKGPRADCARGHLRVAAGSGRRRDTLPGAAGLRRRGSPGKIREADCIAIDGCPKLCAAKNVEMAGGQAREVDSGGRCAQEPSRREARNRHGTCRRRMDDRVRDSPTT